MRARVTRAERRRRHEAGGPAPVRHELGGPETVLSLQRTAGNRAVGALLLARKDEDEGKTGEGPVESKGPAEQEETSTPSATGTSDFGELDGEIASDVFPHAFVNTGRTGQGLWHHCGGTGGKGNEATGAADLVAPVYVTRPPKKPGGQARAWIQKGTGKVTVKRSFLGVPAGAQGAFVAPPPGTVSG